MREGDIKWVKEMKKISLEEGDKIVLQDLRYTNKVDDLGNVLEIITKKDADFYFPNYLKAILKTDKGYRIRIVK